MAAIFQNPFKILTEAAKCEDCEVDNLNDDIVQGEFEDVYGDTEELDFDLDYTEEMVNIIEQQTSEGPRYLIEADVLAKYMGSANIEDVSVAITKIAEHHSLDADNMCVVIESDDFALELLEEARKFKKEGLSKSRTRGIKSATDVLKLMKTKGIKVVKKKSKKGKKKKK